MPEYNIEAVTHNDWEYASDTYDFSRIVKALLFTHLSFQQAGTMLSEVVEKYFAEDEWHQFGGDCTQAPDRVKCHDDSPYFTMHALTGGGMWEVMDSGRVKAVRNQMVSCLFGEEDETNIFMKQHPIGQCPHYIYYKQVVKDIILKFTSTIYVRCKADDTKNKLQRSMEQGMDRIVYDGDRIEEEIRDVFEYNHDGEVQDINIQVHQTNVTPVRRMP